MFLYESFAVYTPYQMPKNLLLIPISFFIFLCLMVAIFGVNIPFFDQWVFIPYYLPYYFYIFLCFYAIGSALVSGLGRVGGEMGLAQASASRYVTIYNLFWGCNFCFIFLILKNKFLVKKYINKFYLVFLY